MSALQHAQQSGADSAAAERPLIVKLGGAALEESRALATLLAVCQRLHQRGRSLVLVHGGGSLADEMLSQAGFVSQRHQGLRITPREQLPLVVGALAGAANKNLVLAAQQQGLPAVGLSLLDGGMVTATPVAGLGQVGAPEPGNPELLNLLLGSQMVPVVSSIAAQLVSEPGAESAGSAGQASQEYKESSENRESESSLLNVNADDAAAAVCQLIDGELLLLSDVPGVLDSQGSLLPQLDQQAIDQLVASGVIHGGMQVKVLAAQALATLLGCAVRIASWRDSEALLGDGAPGTAVLPAQP